MQRNDVVLVADEGRAKASVPHARLREVSAAFRALDDLFGAGESPEFSIDVPGMTQSLLQVVAAIVILKKSNDAASLDEPSRLAVFAALEFTQVPAEVIAPLIESKRPTEIMRVRGFKESWEVERVVTTNTTVRIERDRGSTVIILCDEAVKFSVTVATTLGTTSDVYEAAIQAADKTRAALFEGFMAALDKVASLGSPYEPVHQALATFVDLNASVLFLGPENAMAFSERLLAPDVSPICREALLPAAVKRDTSKRLMKRPRSGSAVPNLTAAYVHVEKSDCGVPCVVFMDQDPSLPVLSPVMSDDE